MKKLGKTILTVIMGTSLILLNSCNKDEEVTVPENHGTLKGKIYSQNGERHVPVAKVFVDVDGEVYLTETDKKGAYELHVPHGNHTLYMQAGDGSLFFSTAEVSVEKGQTTSVPKSASILNQQADIAFISGAYDNIETIIIDTLGYQADQLTVQDLNDPNILENYAAIFLNCGFDGELETQMFSNLEDYVTNGGSLYASDWAVAYLSGNSSGNMPHNHNPEESELDFAKTCTTPQGGFVPDHMLCTQKQGSSNVLNSVEVVSQDIQNVIGSSTMDVEYDIGGWEVIKNLGSEFDVLIQDNNNYGPLAVRSNSTAPWAQGNGSNSGGNGNNNNGNGNSNNDFVTICHIPPGNPNNPQTITISVNALQAHLNHGCTVGPCEGSGGQVLFTTFHNEPQGNINQDTYDILQNFIMNL